MIDELVEYFKKEVPSIKEFETILADFLGEDVKSYSIEPIPTERKIKKYVDGASFNQFVFQFASKEFYDDSNRQNIENLGFYEKFEKEIESNNKNKILPKISGIQEIECLNNGTVQNVQNGTAKYVIQMRILYLKED